MFDMLGKTVFKNKGGFFSFFVNEAARVGPSSKLWHRFDEYQEAIHAITWQTKCRIYNLQTSCRHMKGGKYRSWAQKDPAITTHTFIDSKTRLKCMLCGTEAWSNSGQDFKFAYLQKLAERSTNHPSSSERVLLEVTQGKVALATFPNTDEGRAALKKKYPNWDGRCEGYPAWYEAPKEDDGLKIPEGHSPIKGVEASTPEAGPDSPGAIIVAAHDDLLYSGSPEIEIE